MDRELEMNLLYNMMLIREFENVVSEYKNSGEIYGMVHCYNGQEAVAVGICENLSQEDYIVSNHRPHGHAIAKGVGINEIMSELFGKSTGTNGGRGGSMHIHDRAHGMITATGIVGSGIPVACGSAFASHYKKDGRVTCVFLGDGATNEGVFSECLNMVSNWNLPVVFVVEDNGLAVTTQTKNTSACRDVTLLAKAYGIEGELVNGQDVEQVYSAGKRAVIRARNLSRPTLIQAKTVRFREHAEGEYYWKMRDTNYRDLDELETEIETNCPILKYESLLIQRGDIETCEIIEIENRIKREVRSSLEFAKKSPAPRKESVYSHVYC